MKKIISVLLTAAMLLGLLAMTSVAANDTCIRLVDTNGSSSYSAGSGDVSNYVIENDGATLIFDVMIEATATPTGGMLSQILAFTGDNNYNNATYNFTEGKFIINEGTQWPTFSQTDANFRLAEKDFTLYKGLWYELAFQFNGNGVVIYVDGTPMVAAEMDTVLNEYIILYPQFCTLLIDNLRVCDKNYNVRDKVGTVEFSTDFSGITSVSGCSIWDFTGAGYSVSQKGRPMPGVSDMVPNRAVDPQISGSYLQYRSGNNVTGVATSPINFTAYNGFTIVEDIRVDRTTVGANFAVRFGTNYAAGYDWDSQSFCIANRAGDGFSTASGYSYAKVEYPLTAGTTYEFAVRQDGNSVTIFLNGVVVAQASNDAFATGFANVQLNHYRMTAAIDNLVVAYSDYDVKEAYGSTLAKLTFDESASYISENVWGFKFAAAGSYGYSIINTASTAKVTVDSVTAVDGAATVGVSFSGLSKYNSFIVSISYPSDVKISKATLASISGAQAVMAPITANPLVISCVMNNATTADTDVVEINFKTPTAAGEHTITATVTPYLDDVEGAAVTGTGTITVPKPEIVIEQDVPSGLDYDGEMLTWEPHDSAAYYGIYAIYTDDEFEELIDETEDSEYELIFTDWFSDPAVYRFRIYAYDYDYNLYGVSKDFVVIFDEDENLFIGLDEYANMLYAKLEDLVSDRVYDDDNQSVVDDCLEMAKIDFSCAADFDELTSFYEIYYAELDAVPENVLTMGKPDGISYNGQALSWNSYSGADHYTVYVSVNGGEAVLLTSSDLSKYEFVFTEKFDEVGEYSFTVYACNAGGAVLAQSNAFVLILDESSTVHNGLAAYARVLCNNLDKLVSDRLYSVADQESVNAALEAAKSEITASAAYADMTAKYNESYAELDAVPVMKVMSGKPEGITYGDDTLTWTALDDAVRYEVYLVAADGSETYVGESSEASYVLPYEENFGVGQYFVKVCAYNAYDKLFAVSDVITLEFADETVVFGDVNGDGVFNTADVAYFARWIAGASLEVYPGADVDGDGDFTVLDLAALRRSAA